MIEGYVSKLVDTLKSILDFFVLIMSLFIIAIIVLILEKKKD